MNRQCTVGSVAALAGGALVTLAGCVTLQVEGTSSAEMKRQLESSFLFASADLFYPDGAPEDAAQLPDLGPAEIAELQTRVASTLDWLLRAHRELGPVLGELFGRPVPPDPQVRVSVVDRGRPVARIGGNGEISLDAKVIQAMFRAAVVSTFETEILLARLEAGGVDDPAAWADEDAQRLAVREMLALKARVAGVEGRSVIGELTHGDTDLRSADEGGSGWHALRQLARRSEVALRSYSVQQLFLLAHELGHAVLGHRAADPSTLDCAGLTDLESEADQYAALMLALATPADAAQDMLGMFGHSLGAGLEDLFARTYELAGFDTAAVSARCPPPDPAERGRRVQESFDAVRSAQIDRLLEEASYEQ
jgi:hypothetical protein